MDGSQPIDQHIRSLFIGPDNALEVNPGREKWPAMLECAGGVFWIDLSGESTESDQILTNIFHFHHLAVEDALRQKHTPRVDSWDDYIYGVFTSVALESNPLAVKRSQLDVFLGERFLVTHQKDRTAAVEEVWSHCASGGLRPGRGADHVLYLLMNAVLEGYASVLDGLDERIGEVEDEVFASPGSETISRLFGYKRVLMDIRRILNPMRDAMNRLARDDHDQIDQRDRVYFRDLYDQLVGLIDLNENMRELVTGGLDAYLSVVSNRLNEVMKTLTVFTVLFLPLTFVTGFFGMNFFGQSYGLSTHVSAKAAFGAACALMVLIPAAMAAWMRRRTWL